MRPAEVEAPLPRESDSLAPCRSQRRSSHADRIRLHHLPARTLRTLRSLSLLLSLTALLFSSDLRAAEDLADERVSAKLSTTAEKGVRAATPEELTRAYLAHAKDARRARLGRALGFSVAGTGAIVGGALVYPESPYYGGMVLATGAGLLSAGLLSLVGSTLAENTARRLRDGSLPPEALLDAWSQDARRARSRRRMFGTLSLVGGAFFSALGVWALADPSIDDGYAAFSLTSGIALLGVGGAFFLIPSGSERSFNQIQARGANLGFAPTPGGAGLSVSGAF